MQLFEELDKGNFVLYAARYYENHQCTSAEEFYEDLNRFKYLKKLFGRYHNKGDLQERLILNHLIVLYNVFGIEAANHMMSFQIEEEYLRYLKPFLVFLNYIPEYDMIEVPMDSRIIDKLRKL
jgi:hypothetical protein